MLEIGLVLNVSNQIEYDAAPQQLQLPQQQ